MIQPVEVVVPDFMHDLDIVFDRMIFKKIHTSSLEDLVI